MRRPRDTIGDGETWRLEAASLGVNPDEPDDHRYFAELDRARSILASFEHHKPSDEQVERIAKNRKACLYAARTFLQCCPVGADQTAALRQLHEAMMTANKAIACEVTR